MFANSFRIAVLASLGALASVAAAQPTFLHPDRVRYDGQCFTLDGKDTFVFSGAFHYFRCPKELWHERFQAIKNAGFNAVETYVAWNWSERDRPSSLNDFSKIDLKDLDEWLTMAEDEFGLYTIVRPGPYICAEWATGGFPNWLASFRPKETKRSMWFRSDDPVFEEWSRHWYKAVAEVVAKHQQYRKPMGGHGVILWQVENEYDFAAQTDEAKRAYLHSLIEDSQKDGIEVPIFTCWTRPIRDPKGDTLLAQAFDNPNQYPRWDIDSVRWATEEQHKAQPWAPKMVTEFQGGWFGQVGGLAAEEQDGISASQINALTLNGIANGMTGLNYYMLFGGTNFGDWAAEGITTSYDYFAPIREWGGQGAKYRAVQAIGNMLKRYGDDLVRSTPESMPAISGTDAVQIQSRKGASGAVYAFVRNTDRKASAKISAGSGSMELGPFGMNVYRYEKDPANGKWLINPAPATPSTLPAPIRIPTAEVAGVLPVKWQAVRGGATNVDLGVWDSRFLFYRATVPKGDDRYLWLKNSGGELYAPSLSAPMSSQGGTAWKVNGGATTMALLNPGWPNGGSGMEKPRGILAALVASKLPEGTTLGDWRAKPLSDPQDRSLTAEGVDTTGWAEGAGKERFPENTTAVIRTTVDLASAPAPETVLSTAGIDDEGWFYVNGKLVGELHDYGVPATFPVGSILHAGRNSVSIVIRNQGGEGGLTGPVSLEMPLPKSEPFKLEWTDQLLTGKYLPYTFNPAIVLPIYEHPKIKGDRVASDSIVVRSRVHFARPAAGAAWQIVIRAGGDGFLTLNGKPLGRYWEVGPQRAYFLPSSWLQDENVLELTVVPGRFGDRLLGAELRPLPMED